MFYAMTHENKKGTIRETFFVTQLRESHTVEASREGDFLVDGIYTFEVGGESKSFKQIKDMDRSYLVIDTDDTQNPHKIPLWLFGFLY
jgi:hypothetical protein